MHAAIVVPGGIGPGDITSMPRSGSHTKAWSAMLFKSISIGSHSVTSGLIGLLVGSCVGPLDGETENDGSLDIVCDGFGELFGIGLDMTAGTRLGACVGNSERLFD